MEKRVGAKLFLFMFILCVMMGSAYASFEVGEYQITKAYSSGDNLKGWVEINFTDQSNNSLFEDSQENSLSLQSILTINPQFSYEISSNGEISSTGIQKLNFDAGPFILPDSEGNISYEMNFAGQEIFTEEISLSREIVPGEINSTINQKLKKISDLRVAISEYDLFSQEAIDSALNLTSFENQIKSIKFDYEHSSISDEEAFASLSLIEIPSSILKTRTSDLIPISAKKENVNLDKIEEVAGGTYEIGKESEYQNAVLGWSINNLNTEISLQGFSKISGGIDEGVVTVFKLNIERTSEKSYPIYLFVDDEENFEFKNNEGELDSGYRIFEISGNSKTYNFYTEDLRDFEYVKFFVAPSLDELAVEDFEVEPFEKTGGFKWVIFVLVVIFLLIIGVIIYVVLQVWYKKKYEAYLFKNKNDLYNIANYISISKKKGMDNEEIMKNLKKAKWSGEQIKYAVRKYSGKRTGMFEIPLEKIIEKTEKVPKTNSVPKRGNFPKKQGKDLPKRKGGSFPNKM